MPAEDTNTGAVFIFIYLFYTAAVAASFMFKWGRR